MITIGCLSKKNHVSTTSGCCNNCATHQQKLFCYDVMELCEFCSVVAIFSTTPHVLKKGVLMYSRLDQKEIIIMTHKFFLKNKRMPLIGEIDEKATRPHASVPNILQTIDRFNNIRLFFTDMINFSALTYNAFTGQPLRNDDMMFFADVDRISFGDHIDNQDDNRDDNHTAF